MPVASTAAFAAQCYRSLSLKSVTREPSRSVEMQEARTDSEWLVKLSNSRTIQSKKKGRSESGTYTKYFSSEGADVGEWIGGQSSARRQY